MTDHCVWAGGGLQNCSPSTGIGSDILLLPDTRTLRRVGELSDEKYFLVSLSKNKREAHASLDSNLRC